MFSFYWLLRYYLGDNIKDQVSTMNSFNFFHVTKEITRLEEIQNNPLASLSKKETRLLEKFKKFIETGRRNFDLPVFGDIPGLSYNSTSADYLVKTERYVLMYVFWKLICTILVVVMNSFNVFCETVVFSLGHGAVIVIGFVGVFLAVGSTYTLAINAQHAMVGRGLESEHCETKFWVIKGGVMILFYQTIMISLLWSPVLSLVLKPTEKWNSIELKQALLNFLTLVELVLLAYLHSRFFPSTPYNEDKACEERAKHCCCTRDTKEHEEIDVGYRSMLNKRHEFHFTPINAFFHALHFSSLHDGVNEVIIDEIQFTPQENGSSNKDVRPVNDIEMNTFLEIDDGEDLKISTVEESDCKS